VRLVRADLIMTGVIFSETVDTDISFDYGIFSPGCRRADFGDVKQLGLKIRNWRRFFERAQGFMSDINDALETRSVSIAAYANVAE
jgi:hypothetical protein